MEFMELLKQLFGDNALNFEQFQQAVTAKGYKLADLSTGNYVGKLKFDNEISTRDTSIIDLKNQIKTRDNDIKQLQEKLTAEGDSEGKIAELTDQLVKLQGDYDTAKKDFESRLGKQSYEFAVKEFANTQQFTSSAARKQFISEMVSENLKMKNGTIIGADDYLKVYKEANEDSFVAQPESQPEPQPEPQGMLNDYKPTFVQPTAPQPQTNDNPFANAFNFSGVRPHETQAQ